MNDYPKVRFVFDRRKKADASHPGVVEIEVYFNRKRKWISTGVSVMYTNWHPELLVTGVVNAFELNSRLRGSMSVVSDYMQLLILNRKDFSWEEFDVFIDNRRQDSTVENFMRNILNGRTDIRETTAKSHRSFINNFVRYGRIKWFGDITPSAIERFNNWMKETAHMSQSSIVAYNRIFKYLSFAS